MKNNWILQDAKIGLEYREEDFDDYGYGEGHSISIGDELEAPDRYGNVHTGVVIGIIRNLDGVPVCYKIWNTEHEDFDYIQAAGSIICDPCGSSQWALERIGYKKEADRSGDHGFYHNERTGDVILW